MIDPDEPMYYDGSHRRRIPLRTIVFAALLILTAYFGYHAYLRGCVEEPRRVLLSPIATWEERRNAIDRIAASGSAAHHALPELLVEYRRHHEFRPTLTAAFAALGRDAEPAIPDLLLSIEDDRDGTTRQALAAIDPKWQDRPEAHKVAKRLLDCATPFSHIDGTTCGPSQERMRAATGLLRLVGDDADRARRILGGLADAKRLIPHLVEHLEGDYRSTAVQLLPLVDPEWERREVTRSAYPALVAQYFNFSAPADSPERTAARERLSKRVPGEVVVAALSPPNRGYQGMPGDCVELLGLYNGTTRRQAVALILSHPLWRFPDTQYEWRFPDGRTDTRTVDRELRNLRQLDPDWERHPSAANTIPTLIRRAVTGNAAESPDALKSLDAIDPAWVRHPLAPGTIPFLADKLAARWMEGVWYDDHLNRIDHATRAAALLERFGTAAREALPALLVARGEGFPEKVREKRPKEAEVYEALVKRLPDAIDPHWPDAPEALPAIPELVKLLASRPVPAAELLGRFGAAARPAMPALRATQIRLAANAPEKASVIGGVIQMIEQ